jgi:hypothetical protein
LAYGAWGGVSFFVLLSSRYLGSFYKARIWLHVASSATLSSLYVASLIWAKESTDELVANRLSHKFIGGSTQNLLIAVIVGGIIALNGMQ